MKTDTLWTRRRTLRFGAGSLLAAGLWPGVLRSEGAKDTSAFHFIAVNDLHYLNEKCGPWFERVRKQMMAHAEKPEFCLILGDFAENGTPAQHGPMRDFTRGLGMPAHVVVGNHDYGEQTSRKTFDEMYPGQLNYHFEHRGWQFVGLDTTEGTNALNTTIQKPTLTWLDDNLPKLDRKKPTVIFTHFPPGPDLLMRPKNSDAFLERFKDFNLQAVFSGHYHGFTERVVGAATMTTNKCCSFARGNHDRTPQKGYFLCSAKDGKITRTFVRVV